ETPLVLIHPDLPGTKKSFRAWSVPTRTRQRAVAKPPTGGNGQTRGLTNPVAVRARGRRRNRRDHLPTARASRRTSPRTTRRLRVRPCPATTRVAGLTKLAHRRLAFFPSTGGH